MSGILPAARTGTAPDDGAAAAGADTDSHAATPRDHGGGVDEAARRFGGSRADWIDLSTGINPVPWPVPHLPSGVWTALPDREATAKLEAAAQRIWRVPESAAVLAAPGASALIARIPALAPPGRVGIPGPTYNEHAAAFRAAGWEVAAGGSLRADARVAVHPNNPDGRVWTAAELPDGPLTVIDESFCDICPEVSLIALAERRRTLVLKSFGKFWGLAGLRLGFAIGDPALIARLAEGLGPWPVSGPALAIGAAALSDTAWAETSRARLARDAARLDALMVGAGATVAGGTILFRLYDTQDAAGWQARLARHRIWSRIFPWSDTRLRLGLPGGDAAWSRLAAAL
ncbi:MAG: threonine-phosphate decarboxylase [Rhodobacteraceae bacterium]|nr:threonine-phosphate decarboxylase [Paracoccaceae bacterium]